MTSYAPLRPIPYAQMLTGLKLHDVLEMCIEPAAGCAVLRQMRMGLGTGDYYPFPYESQEAIVPEPMLAGVLAHFGIDHAAFMHGCTHGELASD